jgi:hypothetical protein
MPVKKKHKERLAIAVAIFVIFGFFKHYLVSAQYPVWEIHIIQFWALYFYWCCFIVKDLYEILEGYKEEWANDLDNPGQVKLVKKRSGNTDRDFIVQCNVALLLFGSAFLVYLSMTCL